MSRVSSSLNFMYKMEQFATRIYLVQRGAFKGSDVADKLTAASENEQTHVELLRAQITDLKIGLSPWGFLFKIAAIVVGTVTRICGKTTIMRADIFVESRAVKDYGNYVKKIGYDEKTAAMLKRIIEDEERHVAIWRNSLNQLKESKKA
jgi:bacterioferritin